MTGQSTPHHTIFDKRGGMGVVDTARDTKHDRAVAVMK
jgi:hypothetical protein